MLIISVLKSQNYDINSRLESTTKDLTLPKKNLSLNKKQSKNLKEQIKECSKSQKEKVRAYEKDEKRFKLMKRYGEILSRIEKLYGLLPTNLESFSLEELEEKLQEFLKNRKRNELQMIFIFYQTLYTNSIQNLLTIEKDYQAGIISQKEARISVVKIHKEIDSEEAHVPKALENTHKEVKHLIFAYEDSYSQEIEEKTKGERSKLVDTEFNLKHKVLIEKLNENANELIDNVNCLSTDLSNFEPAVNVTKLTETMKDVESDINLENFDPNLVEKSLNTLEGTTNKLIDEQIEKNETGKKITEEIQEETTKAKELSAKSMQEVSTELFENANERANTCYDSTTEVEEILESALTIPTEITNQIANTVISQMEADLEFCEQVKAVPDSEKSIFEEEKTEETLAHAENLKELVNKKEQDLGMILTLEQQNEIEKQINELNKKEEN